MGKIVDLGTMIPDSLTIVLPYDKEEFIIPGDIPTRTIIEAEKLNEKKEQLEEEDYQGYLEIIEDLLILILKTDVNKKDIVDREYVRKNIPGVRATTAIIKIFFEHIEGIMSDKNL